MPDLASDWADGETRGPIKEVISVKASGAIAAGDFVRISGIDANNEITGVTQGATSEAMPIGGCLFSVASGKYAQVLTRGFFKPKFVTAGTPSAGARIAIKNGKLIVPDGNHTTTSTTSAVIGRWMSKTAAAGDTGLIFLDCLGGSGGKSA